MHHRHGFTLAELAALLLVVALTLSLFVVTGYAEGSFLNRRARAKCAANLRSLGQAMFIYAQVEDDAFPVAGKADPDKPAQGFQSKTLGGMERYPLDVPEYQNNLTASMWLLVRDGSASMKTYICPESGDVRDSLERKGRVTVLKHTWDFGKRESLSYSMPNFYHKLVRRHWSTSARGSTVLLGDNNNADGPDIHTLAADRMPSQEEVARLENSHNHRQDGQNFLFADASVRFFTTPFQGVEYDNVYAMTIGGKNAAPSLKLNAGDHNAVAMGQDVALIPLSGNNGVSLSGKPGVAEKKTQPTADTQPKPAPTTTAPSTQPTTDTSSKPAESKPANVDPAEPTGSAAGASSGLLLTLAAVGVIGLAIVIVIVLATKRG